MKLVKQASLVLADPRAPKVYEVDLCEVGGGRFVVNYRHGKRGRVLEDGTKTVAPVAQAEAERIFDKLVEQQIQRGFVPALGLIPTPPTPSAPPLSRQPSLAPLSHSRQKERILARLSRALDAITTDDADALPEGALERLVWRAGELRLREAEGLLLALADRTASDRPTEGAALLDYCIAWALGRLGSDRAIPTLRRLQNDEGTPPHVKRIATLALQARAASDSTSAATDLVDSLPEELRTLARGSDPDAFATKLRAFLEANGPNAWGVVDLLYAIDTEAVRPAVLAELARVPLVSPYFYFVRHVFKAAEYRHDARVFGLLAYRFEKTRANLEVPENKGVKPPFGKPTRRYLRRRIWRTLRRLGQIGDLDYVDLAVGVLLPFVDTDAVPARGPGISNHGGWDRWAPYWAFNGILYGNSKRYAPSPLGERWHFVEGAGPDTSAEVALTREREEAFPSLWEARPEGLMILLAESACVEVHRFAVKAIRACPTFLVKLDVDDIVTLLARPYQETARLGLELAEKRYDKTDPNFELLVGLARSVHAPARAKAFGWLDEQRARLFVRASVLAELVVAPHADTREFARRLLRSTSLAADVAAPLLARVVAAMLALPDTPEGDRQAKDAAATLLVALASHLAVIGPEVVRDLLAHTLSGVQELGVELLLRRDGNEPLDAETLVAVVHSAHANVRAAGMRLLAQLPEGALAQMELLLVRLSADKNADLRNASRPLVTRVATSHPSAGETIARALVEALLRRKLPQGADAHITSLLGEDLIAIVEGLPIADVARLLHSLSPYAQELGGALLQRTDLSRLTIEQVVGFASHDILTVRQVAWRFFEQDVDRIRAKMAEAVRVLDAKWEDSRAFAFGYFRDRVPEDAFEADVLVTILDSVREDVQAFGRELATKYFREADGPTLMAKLAEHPSPGVRVFVTNYLTRYAADRPDVLDALVPYFTTVLSHVNAGRVAKRRVIAFLTSEGAKSEEAANLVIGLLHRVSATIAIEMRAATIAAMMAIHRAQPGADLPLRVVSPPVRGADGVPVRV